MTRKHCVLLLAAVFCFVCVLNPALGASAPLFWSNASVSAPVYYDANLPSNISVNWDGNGVPVNTVLIEGDWSGAPANYTPVSWVTYEARQRVPDSYVGVNITGLDYAFDGSWNNEYATSLSNPANSYGSVYANYTVRGNLSANLTIKAASSSTGGDSPTNTYCYNGTAFDLISQSDQSPSNKTVQIPRSCFGPSVITIRHDIKPQFYCTGACIQVVTAGALHESEMKWYWNQTYAYSSVLPAGAFYWKSYAKNADGNWNSTTLQAFTIQSHSSPQWSGNQSSTPAVYSPTASQFNITWNAANSVTLDTVLIEGNWSGTPKNYTMTTGIGLKGVNITPSASWGSWSNGNYSYDGQPPFEGNVGSYGSLGATFANLNGYISHVVSAFNASVTLNITSTGTSGGGSGIYCFKAGGSLLTLDYGSLDSGTYNVTDCMVGTNVTLFFQAAGNGGGNGDSISVYNEYLTGFNFSKNSDYHYNETLSAGNFYWKSYANDSDGIWSVSDKWVFTIMPFPAPQWSDNRSSYPAIYSPTAASQFNITWVDGSTSAALDTVLLEGNWSGAPVNYTLSAFYYPAFIVAANSSGTAICRGDDGVGFACPLAVDGNWSTSANMIGGGAYSSIYENLTVNNTYRYNVTTGVTIGFGGSEQLCLAYNNTWLHLPNSIAHSSGNYTNSIPSACLNGTTGTSTLRLRISTSSTDTSHSRYVNEYELTGAEKIAYSYENILPAGTFYWKSYANDSGGRWNSTDAWQFTISGVIEQQQNNNNQGSGGGGSYFFPANASNSTNKTAAGTVMLSITAEPTSVVIKDDGPKTVVLRVSNSGTAPADVSLVASGVPADWVSGLKSVSLGGNDAKSVPITVDSKQYGNWTLTVTASSGAASKSVSIPVEVWEIYVEEPEKPSGMSGLFSFNVPNFPIEFFLIAVLGVISIGLFGVFAGMMKSEEIY